MFFFSIRDIRCFDSIFYFFSFLVSAQVSLAENDSYIFHIIVDHWRKGWKQGKDKCDLFSFPGIISDFIPLSRPSLLFHLSPPRPNPFFFLPLYPPLSSLCRWKNPPHGLVDLSNCVQHYTGCYYCLLLLQVSTCEHQTHPHPDSFTHFFWKFVFPTVLCVWHFCFSFVRRYA